MKDIGHLLHAWTFLLLVLALTCLLAGCSGSQEKVVTPQTENSTRVYYVNSEGNGILTANYALTSTGDTAVEELFEVLKNGQYNDGRSAIPDGVELDHSAWQETALVLYLTGDYPDAGTVEEILCRCALVCTMAQVDDVGSVMININNMPLSGVQGEEIGAMTAGQFLSDVVTSEKESDQIVKLYFANEEGDRLIPESLSMTKTADQSIELQIVNQLIEGPLEEGFYRSIPSGTKVISVTVKNRICYVNLDDTFSSENSTLPDYIPVYSLVNSLTALEDVDSVQLMINGSTDVTFGESISFAAPLEADEEFNE